MNVRHHSKFYLVNNLQIFSNLSEKEKQLISDSCKLVEFEKGEILYHKTEMDAFLYILLSGSAAIYDQYEDEGVIKEDTKEVLRRGDILGLVSFLNSEPHSFHCKAMTDLRALRFEHNSLHFILTKIPSLAFQFSNFLSRRIRDLRIKEVFDYENKTIGILSFLSQTRTEEFLDFLVKDLRSISTGKVELFDAICRPGMKLPEELNSILYHSEEDLSNILANYCKELDHILIKLKIEDLNNIALLERNLDQIFIFTEDETYPEEISQILKEVNNPKIYKTFALGSKIKKEFQENRLKILAREIHGTRLGIAFGGGAALGLAQIGIIQVLEEANITVDIISGTSIGSLVGGLWAAGLSGKDMEEICNEFDSAFKMFKLVDLAIPTQGLLSGKNVIQFLEKYLKEIAFNELKIPFRAVACDITNRNEIVLRTGKLSDGIRASTAIPGVFAPIPGKKGEILVDGGVVNPLPVSVISSEGVKKIIAINSMPSSNMLMKSSIGQNPNFFDIMVNSLYSLQYRIAKFAANDADVYMNPILPKSSWYEFYRAKEFIQLGRENAQKLLPEIKSLITND
jgi:predicted acylesterase/phospholipase RssA/CRP-like cAMP-binding protein